MSFLMPKVSIPPPPKLEMPDDSKVPNLEDTARMEQEAEDMRKIYEPLFSRYHVNMVFSGHVHSYERTHAIYNEQVVASHKASS